MAPFRKAQDFHEATEFGMLIEPILLTSMLIQFRTNGYPQRENGSTGATLLERQFPSTMPSQLMTQGETQSRATLFGREPRLKQSAANRVRQATPIVRNNKGEDRSFAGAFGSGF